MCECGYVNGGGNEVWGKKKKEAKHRDHSTLFYVCRERAFDPGKKFNSATSQKDPSLKTKLAIKIILLLRCEWCMIQGTMLQLTTRYDHILAMV